MVNSFSQASIVSTCTPFITGPKAYQDTSGAGWKRSRPDSAAAKLINLAQQGHADHLRILERLKYHIGTDIGHARSLVEDDVPPPNATKPPNRRDT